MQFNFSKSQKDSNSFIFPLLNLQLYTFGNFLSVSARFEENYKIEALVVKHGLKKSTLAKKVLANTCLTLVLTNNQIKRN